MQTSMARYWICILCVTWAWTASSSAHADTRVALVIGNAAYQTGPALDTPVHDATDIADVLKTLGFAVTVATNLNGEALVETMDRFTRELAGADVALLYLSGHGMQFRGANYFLPIDSKLRNAFSVRREAFPIQDLIEHMDARAGVNLVFLDVSRKNPISEAFARALANDTSAHSDQPPSREIGRGLGIMPSLRGETLLAYSATVGTESSPGTGRNSPFAQALLKHFSNPDVEIEVMLKRVAGDSATSHGWQAKAATSLPFDVGVLFQS